jgi:hypothetical protein
MKRLGLFVLASCFSFFSSCEREDKQESGSISLWLGDPDCEICEQGFQQLVPADNLLSYDSSAHLFYLSSPLNPPLNSSELYSYRSFSLRSEKQTLFTGIFQPLTSSSLPAKPFIMVPSLFYPDDLLHIDNMSSAEFTKRNEFYRILIANGKLQAGLKLELTSVGFQNNLLTYSYKLINKGKAPLMVLDPDRCSTEVFFWYCSEPSLFNGSSFIFREDGESNSDPGFNESWFQEIKGGDSVSRSISLTGYTIPVKGNYSISISFTGPSRSRSERYISSKRIWIGSIHTAGSYLIN